jgi:hypothetical protein
MVDAEALAEYDPVGGKMVKKAMAMIRKRK